jgi:hypothetical protein
MHITYIRTMYCIVHICTNLIHIRLTSIAEINTHCEGNVVHIRSRGFMSDSLETQLSIIASNI